MKKIKTLFKISNLLIVILVVVAVTLTISVYAATVVDGTKIGYSNSTSKLSSTDIQGALDEIYTDTMDIRKYSNIVSAYTYNASTCVTGEESTCVATTCYKSTTANSCKAGDIIKYKVNDTDIVTFHVMYDKGTTMTMQSQKNIVRNTPWMGKEDYTNANTDATSCSHDACVDEGPLTAMKALERTTQGWTNVDSQFLTMGRTEFIGNLNTGCNVYNNCTKLTYSWESSPRTGKARMITLQEAVDLGCTDTNSSCPKWMYNYLSNSTSYGGTVNDTALDPATAKGMLGYWTMNASSYYANNAWGISPKGIAASLNLYSNNYGIRAVVSIKK